MSALTSQRATGTVDGKTGRVATGMAPTTGAAGVAGSFRSTQQSVGPTVAEKSPRVSTAVTERMIGVGSDEAADRLAGFTPSDKTGRLPQGPNADRFANDVAPADGRTGLAAALSTSQRASVGRQSSFGGVYANGGINSTPAPALSDKTVVGVTRAGAGWTEVSLADGTVEKRSGKGTRSTRNNNPGNVEYGPYAKSKGAVGTDGRFAVFGTKEQGLEAIGGLVFGSKKYAGATVREAIGIYAPEFENDTAAYAASVAKAAGVTVNTKVADLTPQQRTAMVAGMVNVEGGTPYKTTTVQQGQPATVASAFAGRAPPTPAQTAIAQAAPRNAPISAEVRAAAAKRNVDAQEVANYADKFGMAPDDAAFAVTPQSQLAGYRPIGPSATEQAAAPAPSAQRFASTYLGTTSTPTARPTDAPAPNVERTLPDKVLAGAIDVGVGMIPGLGTAAGLYGLAAPMLGLPTVGDMALNLRDTNQFDVNATANKSQAGSGAASNRLEAGAPELKSNQPEPEAAIQEAQAAPVSSSSFAEKYLGYSDPTPRPTPEQKWGGMGSPTPGYTL